MAVEPDEPSLFQVPVGWVGLEDQPILLVNQFISQVHQDEIMVALGQVAPPALIGSPEEQRKQAEDLTYVPVRTITRVILTRSRAAELMDVLKTTLETYDAAHRTGGAE